MIEKDEIEIDLQELFFELIKRLWVIILAVVVCAASTFGYTYLFVEPQYQSDAMIFVNGASSSFGDIEFTISAADVSSGEDLISTYITILRTRDTLNEVIDYLGADYTVTQLNSMISMSAVTDTSIVQIVVTCEDPYEAEEVATAITKILPEKISEIIDGTSVRIVDTAIVNTYPVSPNYSKNVLMGALFGAVASAVIIVIMKLLDNKVTSAEYVKTSYKDIPMLATIPVISTVNKNK
ncbi:MAG: Wzz/FepE/Etk N-terminal domain-containing protein [Clostridia bacterium]